MFTCENCKRQLKSQTGLKLHLRCCQKKYQQQHSNEDTPLTSTADKITMLPPVIPPKPPEPSKITNKWGERDSIFVEAAINEIYEEIVFWRKNLFMLPTGRAGKSFIDEMEKLLNTWVDNTAMKDIALKAIMIMPSLLLQKPSKDSKSRDHLKALERRIELWQAANFKELNFEAKTIQER